MSCEICGRGGCTRSFHSHEAQRAHDDKMKAIEDPVALYYRAIAAEEKVIELECQLSALLKEEPEEQESE